VEADTAVAPSSAPRRRHRWRRALLVVALVVVVLVVVGRLLLDPVAAHYTRRALDNMPDFKGSFQHVHVTLLPPSYQITHIKLIEARGGVWKEPLFYAQRVRAEILWRKLLERSLVARTRIDGPKVVIARNHEEKTKEAGPGLAQQLKGISPLTVDRVEVRDGEVLWAESPAQDSPRIWLHDIEAAVENFATRPALAQGRPTILTLAAVVQKSGRLSAFVSADPFAKGLTFGGRTALEHLDLRDLHAFMAEKTDMEAKKGTLDVFAEFQARAGKLTGGVKPVLKDVEIGPTDSGLLDRLKAWLADKAVELVSDRVPGRKAVATVVPIRGTLDRPDIQLGPAILGVVRNAFVVGLTSGFAYVPPPVADEKKGILRQAGDALQKKPGPPAAQPESGGGGKGTSTRPGRKS
jgi:hypothetical protein